MLRCLFALPGATAASDAAATPGEQLAESHRAPSDALEGAWILGLRASARRRQRPAADRSVPLAGLAHQIDTAGAAAEYRTICDNYMLKKAICHRVRKHLEPRPLGPAIYQGN